MPEKQQFQEQLKRCIRTPKLRLTTKYMSKGEAEQSVKCLNVLKNKSSSYARKRKTTSQALGDYQKAMAIEAVKGKLAAPTQMDVLTASPLSDRTKKKKDAAFSQMDVLTASPVSYRKKKEDTAPSQLDVSAKTTKAKEEKSFCKSNVRPLPKDFFDHPVFAKRPVDPKLKEWERRKEFIDGVVDSRYSRISTDVSSNMESNPSPLAPSIRAEKSLPTCVLWETCQGANTDYGQTESEDPGQPLEDDDDVEESAYRRDTAELYEQSSSMNRLAALLLKYEQVRLTAGKANTKCSEEDEYLSDSDFEEQEKKFADWRWKGGNMN